MPEPVTVWMVHLERGRAADDRKGRLSMEDALVFTDVEDQPVRFAFESIRRVKRLRGSPVLLLDWTAQGTARRTAFYFAKPPPMESVETQAPPSAVEGGIFRRPKSKRRQARETVGYLQVSNRGHKPSIEAWVRELSSRIGP